MKRICSCVVLFILLSPMVVLAQETKDDLTLVKESVENYFEGYIHRDLARLELAFDTENGTMKLPTKSDAGEEGFENGLFKEIVPKWAGREKLSKEVLEQSKLEFQSINVVSPELAVVVIRMQVGDQVYIDVLSLQQINAQWKITNKMYIALQ